LKAIALQNTSTKEVGNVAATTIAKEVIQKVSSATVTIEVPNFGAGSGFFMKDADGVWLVSNTHVVGEAYDKSVLKVFDQHGKPVPMTNEARADLEGDIAMVKVDPSFEPAAILTQSETIAIGESILAVGNAKGDGIIYPLEGVVKGQGSLHGVPILEMSAQIVPGCSGGPVVNAKGELIGITTFYVLPQAQGGKKKGGEKAEQTTEEVDPIFKGTPFAEPRRMAVRSTRIPNAAKLTVGDIYVYTRASNDRVALFTLYSVLCSVNNVAELQAAGGALDEYYKEATKPVMKGRMRGIQPSGMVNEYNDALVKLKAMKDSLIKNVGTLIARNKSSQHVRMAGTVPIPVAADKEFLTLLKKRLPSTVAHQQVHEAIDKLLDERLEKLSK
jgi:hypothetical protein